MFKRYIITVFIAALSFFCISCEYQPPDKYSLQVNKKRLSKDSLFKWYVESPLQGQDRIDFIELKYFAPDSTYKVEAILEKFESPDTILIENNIGRKEKYFRFGKMKFTLKGKPSELVVYQQEKLIKEGRLTNHLFMPFWDETNGEETYSGGRFMDLEYIGNEKIVVDFNFAYNPYCAYSEAFTCPLPPAENRLKFRVEAGEKIYRDHPEEEE